MAKIVRAKQKIFGDDVVAQDQHCVFGSLKAGSVAYSKDPATIQSLAAWGTGWKGATVNNQAPVLQDENALHYLITRQIAYILQAGIAEYDSTTEYHTSSFCQVAGVIYRSIQDTNVNHAVTDNAWWLPLVTPNDSGEARGTVPLGSIIAMGNVQAWALPTADQVKDGYALCNGNTFAALGAGNYNAAFTGNRPTLNDSRFLMGSTAVGSTGGANSLTLAASNIPTLYNSTVAVSGTTNIGHSHTLGASGVVSGNPDATGNTLSSHTHTSSGDSNDAFVRGAGSISTAGSTYGIVSANTRTTGLPSAVAHTHTTDINHTHTLGTTNVALASGVTGTITVGTASPVALENRPLYFSVVYLMRVK
jgi:hypothetical protein